MKKQKRKEKYKFKLKDFLCREENLVRDIVIIAIILALLSVFVMNLSQSLFRQTEEEDRQLVESPELEIPDLDTTAWKAYQSQFYAFKLKYPDGWQKPTLQPTLRGAKWEYKYQFRKNETDENDSYIGFDVVVYNVKKIKELTNTEEYPTFKFEMNENETCRFIPSHVIVEPTFFVADMYVSPTDDCYKQAFFYSFIRDEYIYNVVPISKENRKTPADFKKDVVYNFPEFFSVISNFNLTVLRKAPLKSQPIIGRGTHCPAKNDNPSISSRKPKNHMDEDCCSDFDEWPKPGCFYTAKDYAIMLEGPTSGHVKHK